MKNRIAIQLIMTVLAVVFLMSIATAQANENQTSTVNNPKLQSGNSEISKAIADIAELLKTKVTVWVSRNKDQREYTLSGTKKNISALEDKIVFSFKDENTTIYFSDLADYTIQFFKDDRQNEGPTIGNFLIYSQVKGVGKKLYDDLVLIQQVLYEKIYTPQLLLFKTVAAQYRALKVKPTVSEDQRKYIVQANLFNQEKNYTKEIELYNKAVELDQTSYPAAYSNLALLTAQLQKFSSAIYYMKKYLLLEPDAADARSGQDKIYEWEAQLSK